MKKRIVAVASVVALLVFNLTPSFATIRVPANITEQMLFADDPKEWLTVTRVLQPVFPPEMLTSGVTGHVDVAVTINEMGKVHKIGAVVSKPANPAFEKSVVDSLRHWAFRPPISLKCIPEVAEGNVRVWFEIRDGKELISVSSLPPTPARSAPDETRPDRLKMLNHDEVRRSVIYPEEARRARLQADVYAVMNVVAASGIVDSVEISHAITSSKEFGMRALFKNAVIGALNSARFEPIANSTKRLYKVCVPHTFRLTD